MGTRGKKQYSIMEIGLSWCCNTQLSALGVALWISRLCNSLKQMFWMGIGRVPSCNFGLSELMEWEGSGFCYGFGQRVSLNQRLIM